jgi:hypothetical protein
VTAVTRLRRLINGLWPPLMRRGPLVPVARPLHVWSVK